MIKTLSEQEIKLVKDQIRDIKGLVWSYMDMIQHGGELKQPFVAFDSIAKEVYKLEDMFKD